jgi:hypothetical protein
MIPVALGLAGIAAALNNERFQELVGLIDASDAAQVSRADVQEAVAVNSQSGRSRAVEALNAAPSQVLAA